MGTRLAYVRRVIANDRFGYGVLVAATFGVVAACHGRAPVVVNRTAVAEPSPMDRARAFERGRGAPRDYAAAADIYRERCADGDGDAAACRRFLRAQFTARGVDRDVVAARALATRLCERKHDRLGCFIALLTGHDPKHPLQAAVDVFSSPRPPCDAAHLDVCETPLDVGFGDQSSSHERAERAANREACAVGVLDGCIALIDAVVECEYEPGEVACADHVVREWGKDTYDHDRIDALARVRDACDAGDADACGALPGREIASAELCRAHDWGACAAAGCLGDAAASAAAAVHHGDASCFKVRNRAAARAAPPPPPDPRPALHADPVPTITPSARRPFDSIAFRALGEWNDFGWPRYEIYNLGDKKIVSLHALLYAYDAAGNQVDRMEFGFTTFGGLDLAPGAGQEIAWSADSTRPETAVTFEGCYDVIRFEGDHDDHRARCPLVKPRGTRWGDGGDSVIVRASSFDADGQAIIDDFERSHPGVMIDQSGGSVGERTGEVESSYEGAPAGSGKPPAKLIELPLALTPVSVVFHVDGVRDLRLTAPTLARILQRDVTRWNDPAIARDNPGVALPDLPIVVMHDFGGPATTAVTRWLAARARGVWRIGSRDSIKWPDDTTRMQFDNQLAEAAASTSGAIALLGPNDAHATGLPVVRLGRDATFAAPIPSDATSGAYPLVYTRTLRLAIAPLDHAEGTWIETFARYLLTDGQDRFEKLGYGRLPAAVAKRALASLGKLEIPK